MHILDSDAKYMYLKFSLFKIDLIWFELYIRFF